MTRRQIMRGAWGCAAAFFGMLERALWRARFFCIMKRLRYLEGL